MKKQILFIVSAILTYGLFGQCNPNPKYKIPEGYELVKRVNISMKENSDNVKTYDFAMAFNEEYRLMFVEEDKYKKIASYELYEESSLLGSNYVKKTGRFYPEFYFKCRKGNTYQVKVNRLVNKQYCGTFILLKKMKEKNPVMNNNQEPDPKPEEQVFVIVEEMAVFIEGKGFDGFREWVNENLKYPEKAKKEKIQGRVFIQFCVDATGMVKDVEVVRGVHPVLDKEAFRVISESPKWHKPGYQRGKAVKVKYTMPVAFVLN